jgi:multidrug resistance efflux pump
MERVFRSRLARAGLAGLLLLCGAWGFSPYILGNVGEAYVNADLKRITTPVAGVLGPDAPAGGSYVDKDRLVTLVTARAPDRTALGELERQTAAAEATVELMQSQVQELDRADRAFGARSAAYRTATLADLAGAHERGQADLASCEAHRRADEDRAARIRPLVAEGYATVISLRAAEETVEADRQACLSAAASLRSLEARIQAARQGVYIDNGSGDTPFAEQQRSQLLLQRQQRMDELIRAQAALGDLQRQEAVERRRYDSLARFTTVLPAGHIVWNLQARPGSAVSDGQTLMELADCSNRYVMVTLPARRIETLSVGGQAQVRLVGSSQWLQGRIRRIVGGGARQDEQLLTAAPPKSDGKDFVVEVSLENGPAPDPRRSCDIGRQAEVRFGQPMIRPLALLGAGARS